MTSPDAKRRDMREKTRQGEAKIEREREREREGASMSFKSVKLAYKSIKSASPSVPTTEKILRELIHAIITDSTID